MKYIDEFRDNKIANNISKAIFDKAWKIAKPVLKEFNYVDKATDKAAGY